MAGGWAKDGAVQEQIDASVDDAIAKAKSLIPKGESAQYCEECGEPIPKPRQIAVPGVSLCIACQGEAEKIKRLQQQSIVEGVKIVSCAEQSATNSSPSPLFFL